MTETPTNTGISDTLNLIETPSDAVTIQTYDLIIVGSGSGNSIPEYLADRRIAIVERGVFGGTCLNRGCIPSKMLVLPADVAETVRHGERLGVRARIEHVDWPGIRDRVFGRIDAIAGSGEEYRATGSPNVTLYRGTARFVAERMLEIEGLDGTHTTIAAKQVLLAAGASPALPLIPGLDEVAFHTSDTVMRLDRFPERIGILGGGFIAAEMGHVFAGLGAAVTVFNRSEQMLRLHDHDISERFTKLFSQRVDFRGGSLPDRLRQEGEHIVAEVGGESLVFDQLLVATGRVPNSGLLNLAAGGVATHPDGRVMVDPTMATSAPGVWAIGDLTNAHQLKHLANAEVKVAFWNIAHPEDRRRLEAHVIPSAVFSDPQVACVGFTEQQAIATGYDVVIGRRDYGGTAYGWALEDETSFAKVIVERTSGQILGAHILGPQAATLIQPLITAMQFGITAEPLARQVMYIHPALTEVVENALLDAVEQLESGQ